MEEGELRRKRLGKEIGLDSWAESGHTMRQVDSRFRVGAWWQRGAERWTRLIRDQKGMWKFVPQLRCSMPKRTVSYPETWLNWRTEESDHVWWLSRTWRLYGDCITKVYCGLENWRSLQVVDKGVYLMLVWRWSNVFKYYSNCSITKIVKPQNICQQRDHADEE